MAKEQKTFETDEAAGAPEWMVTFSDCMTLLLTFFVLLLSFSSFDEKVFDQLKNKIGAGMPSVSADIGSDNDELSAKETIVPVEKVDKGSRLPTLDNISEGNISKRKRLTDFRSQKVFAIDSAKVFVGNGTALHPESRETLGKMAAFLKVMQSRVVICEFDPQNGYGSDALSINRSWVVMNFLLGKNIKAERMSITGSGMLAKMDEIDKRQVVITLLERDIYE